MLKWIKQFTAILLLSAILVTFVPFASADSLSGAKNPILGGTSEITTVKTKHKYLNILLMGVDLSKVRGARGSGSRYKKNLLDCHTDGMIVIAVDQTDKTVSLVSIPRDSIAYVPGHRGLYKINMAFNFGETKQECAEISCKTVSWFLGGIKVDKYVAIDIDTMLKICKLIGGLQNFNVEMNYIGHSKKEYKKGIQDLDEYGILDYLRARRNATEGDNDVARNTRQREILYALFEKIVKEPSLINKIMKFVNNERYNLWTNLSNDDISQLTSLALKIKLKNVKSYGMEGSYRKGMKMWNFTFVKEDSRRNVIKSVWGVDVGTLNYTSFSYTEFLYDQGFTTIRYLQMANAVIQKAKSMKLNKSQQALYDDLLDWYKKGLSYFDTAALSQSDADIRNMRTARGKIQYRADELGKAIGMASFSWNYKGDDYGWWTDPYINEGYWICWE